MISLCKQGGSKSAAEAEEVVVVAECSPHCFIQSTRDIKK
jgi:hypothetical protein